MQSSSCTIRETDYQTVDVTGLIGLINRGIASGTLRHRYRTDNYLFGRQNLAKFALRLVCVHLMELMELGQWVFLGNFVFYCIIISFTSPLLLSYEYSLCSTGIENVVDENTEASAHLHSEAMCNSCEMAVVWMQNQLLRNQTEERILNYVDEVRFSFIHVSLTFAVVCVIHV